MSYSMFGPSLSKALYHADQTMTNQIIQGILGNSDYLAVALYDKLADRYTLRGTLPIDVQELESLLFSKHANITLESNPEIIGYQHPLMIINDLGKEQHFGNMMIFSHKQIAFNQIKETVILVFFNSLIKASILVGMFLLVFHHLLIKPLEKIKNVVMQIDSNNLASLRLDLHINKKNELFELQFHFNNLMEKLSTAQSQIAFTNKELELKVEDRTKELKRLNENLESRIQKAVRESRRQEAILQQQSKLATMGEMIANIAHQWRQPLATNNTIVAILREKEPDELLENDYLDRKLNEIEETNTYMSATIEDFLGYFKPNKSKETFDVKEIIHKTMAILKGKIKQEGVNIHLSIPDADPITTHKQELIQVVIALLSNAIDAMRENSSDKPKIIEIGVSEAEKMSIAIKDRGKGISDNIMDRIFEPYFTTKPKAQGVGLGLYIAKMITENSLEGTLSAVSDTQGSTFTITIDKA